MRRYLRILDTNIILRYLLGDDPEHSRLARLLIDFAPFASLYLPSLAIAEAVWFFQGRTSADRSSIARSIQRILSCDSITVDPAMLNAVARYAATNLDFADCLFAARSAASGVPVVSFDRGFRKFRDVVAERPDEALAKIRR